MSLSSLSGGITGPAGPIGPGPTIVYKTANQVVNDSSTLANDTHLTATLVTSTNYWFSFLVHYTDASTLGVAGLKAALGGTAVIANLIANAHIMGVVGVGIVFTRWTDLAQEIAEAANSEDTIDLIIAGTVEVTTGGTFLLQWSQSVATAADLTALKGSTLRYQEIT